MKVKINPGASSKMGKGCGTIFFGIFAAMGLLFMGLLLGSGIETARTYRWEATDCTILESSVNESHDAVHLDVRYAYTFQGQSHTSTQYSKGISQSMTAADANRAAQRLAPGTHTICYVDPSSPDESVLVRGSLWMMFFLLIPLVFVAVGVGGIIGVWRAKPPSASPAAISERFSGQSPGARAALIGLRIFGLIFIAVGGGLLYFMLLRPTLRGLTAANWPRVPCEILSSQVASHRASKGGQTYSVDIRYRYVVGDRTYTGASYSFEAGSSSSSKWRYEVVAKYPPGLKTVCYVNPAVPIDAVLSTEASPDRWFGLIPGVFLLVGLGVFFKAPAMVGKRVEAGIAARGGAPVAPMGGARGPIELKPASTPVAAFVVVLIIAAFWNGITWAILLNMPSSDTFGRIFLSIFALIGAGLLAAVVYQFLALFNPRPTLIASSGSIPLGGMLDVQWRFTGSVRRLVKLTISLEGREEATYQRGTTTTTDRNIFAILPLVETTDRVRMGGGSARLTIPGELMHTFTANRNKIVWTLHVAGDIPKWPDVDVEFPIVVLPREPATFIPEATTQT